MLFRSVVKEIVKVLNGPLLWLGNGLTVAGAVLPAVGFAILLHYLPVKKHFAYLILGFTFTTLFTTVFGYAQLLGGSIKGFSGVINGLPMLAIALLGLAFAAISYQTGQKIGNAPKAASSNNDEGEIEDDEI